MAKQIPPVFCWTKMGDEAGQSLRSILARKDAERAATGGIFYWGIGSSLGDTIWSFINSTKQPDVLFSPMRARAKEIDANPDRIFAWTAYRDQQGVKHSLPKLTLVTSRGTVGSAIKTRHYALVCERPKAFGEDSWPSLDWSTLENYCSGSRLGFSQVTAIVRHGKPFPKQDRNYPVLFGARLVNPFFVTLADPVEIPRGTWREACAAWDSPDFTFSEWPDWLQEQRSHFQPVSPIKLLG